MCQECPARLTGECPEFEARSYVFAVEPVDEYDEETGIRYYVRQVRFEGPGAPMLGHVVAELYDLDVADLHAVLDALVPPGRGFEAYHHDSGSPYFKGNPNDVLHVVLGEERRS